MDLRDASRPAAGLELRLVVVLDLRDACTPAAGLELRLVVVLGCCTRVSPGRLPLPACVPYVCTDLPVVVLSLARALAVNREVLHNENSYELSLYVMNYETSHELSQLWTRKLPGTRNELSREVS